MSDAEMLAAQLQHAHLEVRVQAAERLSRMGEEAQAWAVALTRACSDDEPVREWAVAALEDLGPPRASDAAALKTLVGNDNSLVAYWAVTLLGRLGEAASSTASALVSVLESSPDAAVRQRAAWALGSIGDRSTVVTRALQLAGESPDPRLASLAAQALAKLA